MKIKKLLSSSLSIMVAGLLILNSCSKDAEQTADTSEGEKATESENIILDAISTANDGLDGSFDGVSSGKTSACSAVVVDMNAKTVLIDFGTDGCVGVNGRTRKGKILITYVGTSVKTATSRTITFTTYSVNNNILSGTFSQSAIQRPTATSVSSSISASNVSLILSDGRTYILSAFQRTFLYEYGDLKIVTDDVSTITGSSTQTGATGNVTSIEITSPIIYKGSCASTGFYYPSSGIYKLIDGKITYTIDWGTGSCDKDISITALGKTVVKTLP